MIPGGIELDIALIAEDERGYTTDNLRVLLHFLCLG